MALHVIESSYSDVGHRRSENSPTYRTFKFCSDAVGGNNSWGHEELVKIEQTLISSPFDWPGQNTIQFQYTGGINFTSAALTGQQIAVPWSTQLYLLI